MIKKNFIKLSIALILIAPSIANASDVWFDISAPTSSRSEKSPAWPYENGAEIIEQEQISRSGDNSIGAVLNEGTGIDIQSRGVGGVQSDISIRGSSFQQNLILIDGMRFNDPQTAHHNLNIPLTTLDIERIEVLKGPYSAVYGSDAFAGVVNIITKTPDKNRAEAEMSFSEFNTRSALLSYDLKREKFSQKISVEKKKSDGFRNGTDFDILNLFAKSNFNFPWSDLNLSFGFLEKDFGAVDFYSSVTENDRENIRAKFISITAPSRSDGTITFEPKMYFRRHNDRFNYSYNSVDYQNKHRTDMSGGEIKLKWKLADDAGIVFKSDYVEEKLVSSNMGDRIAVKKSLSARYTGAFEDLNIDLGFRGDHHSYWGWQYSPSIRADYSLSPNLKVLGMAGKSFRAPSFTELYYQTVANKGNSNLKPEKNWSYEAGLDYSFDKNFHIRSTVYNRDESDLIDWVKSNITDIAWSAKNIGKVNVWGFEELFQARFESFEASFKYSYITKKSLTDYISKYALVYPKHRGDFSLNYNMSGETRAFFKISGIKRENEDEYFLADIELSKKYGDFKLSAGVANIFNVKYEEIPGVPRPGRLLRVTSKYRFF